MATTARVGTPDIKISARRWRVERALQLVQPISRSGAFGQNVGRLGTPKRPRAKGVNRSRMSTSACWKRGRSFLCVVHRPLKQPGAVLRLHAIVGLLGMMSASKAPLARYLTVADPHPASFWSGHLGGTIIFAVSASHQHSRLYAP